MINGAQIANIKYLAPHDVVHFTASYRTGKLALTLRENYFG